MITDEEIRELHVMTNPRAQVNPEPEVVEEEIEEATEDVCTCECDTCDKEGCDDCPETGCGGGCPCCCCDCGGIKPEGEEPEEED